MPSSPADAPWPVEASDAAHQRAIDRVRILLVEDDPSTVELMKILLTRHGYDIRAAMSHGEALRIASEWLPDLLVSDLSLPGKDGLHVLKTMREAHPTLKGIVISGHASPEDVARSREAGFAEHLAKPVNLAELTGAIGRLLAE